MSWKSTNLYGAASIARVCSHYEVTDTRIPGAKFKIKVLERVGGDFMATLNVCLKQADGTPNWMAGLGNTEHQALDDVLKWFMKELGARANPNDDAFEWSDPIDF